MKTKPSFNEEIALQERGYRYIAGIDEVGRGSFAGPLVAAAVILPNSFPYMNLLNDSKVLPEKLREQLSALIKMYSLSYSIVEIPVEYINTLGIGEAGHTAFTQCAYRLSKKPDFFLTDAFSIRKIKGGIQKSIIHGDSISLSIAAASIIAKVYRDSLMNTLHLDYPIYNFRENKGYGTRHHRMAIASHGLCSHHRRSFHLEKYL